MHRDFEWCVSADDLHNYGGKISIERRQMSMHSSCYMRLGDCDFATWSDIAQSLFLRYISDNDTCGVFAKDTARILEVSHDASYVRGSRRSNDEDAFDELIDANELYDLVLGSCLDMADGDTMLHQEIFLVDHFLRLKSDHPAIFLMMKGDKDDVHHTVSSGAAGFELNPEMWTHLDTSRVVGILHAALAEDGGYPARVFTCEGASSQARDWIKTKFAQCAAFQSFCRRWELKPIVEFGRPRVNAACCKRMRYL